MSRTGQLSSILPAMLGEWLKDYPGLEAAEAAILEVVHELVPTAWIIRFGPWNDDVVNWGCYVATKTDQERDLLMANADHLLPRLRAAAKVGLAPDSYHLESEETMLREHGRWYGVLHNGAPWGPDYATGPTGEKRPAFMPNAKDRPATAESLLRDSELHLKEMRELMAEAGRKGQDTSASEKLLKLAEGAHEWIAAELARHPAPDQDSN